jgi:hypothetical protein
VRLVRPHKYAFEQRVRQCIDVRNARTARSPVDRRGQVGSDGRSRIFLNEWCFLSQKSESISSFASTIRPTGSRCI